MALALIYNCLVLTFSVVYIYIYYGTINPGRVDISIIRIHSFKMLLLLVLTKVAKPGTVFIVKNCVG